MGHGKIPLLSLWKGVYLGNRSEATSINLQESICWKISPRIQRLAVRSFPYQPFNIQYRKGVEIPMADALSQVTPLSMEEDRIQLPIIAVNLVTVNIPYSSNVLDNIHQELGKDPTLKVLMHYINIRWPCEWRMLPQELHPYWNFQEEFSVKDRFRQKTLEQIHEGHQGI